VSTLNGEDRLPIFEAVESEWFRRRSRGRFASAQSADSPAPEAPAAQSPTDWRPDGADAYQATGLEATGFAATPRAEADPAMDQSADPVTAEGSVVWNSPGDEAWRAADAIRKPTTAGLTPAGLPIRIPKAHFVPGSAGKPTMPTPTRAAARSPEAVRGRLASFHKGVQKGRDAGRGPYGETPQATPSNEEEESP
jgi:hypothetical protein